MQDILSFQPPGTEEERNRVFLPTCPPGIRWRLAGDQEEVGDGDLTRKVGGRVVDDDGDGGGVGRLMAALLEGAAELLAGLAGARNQDAERAALAHGPVS